MRNHQIESCFNCTYLKHHKTEDGWACTHPNNDEFPDCEEAQPDPDCKICKGLGYIDDKIGLPCDENKAQREFSISTCECWDNEEDIQFYARNCPGYEFSGGGGDFGEDEDEDDEDTSELEFEKKLIMDGFIQMQNFKEKHV